jgi:hypothetical protein
LTAWFKFPQADIHPKLFWCTSKGAANIEKFPTLATLALSVFGAPCNEVKNEGDFSQLGNLLSPQRKSQQDITVERKLFLKLNAQYWTPNPLLQESSHWKEVIEKAKVPDGMWAGGAVGVEAIRVAALAAKRPAGASAAASAGATAQGT